jgi:hypothetical protein
LNPPAGEFTNRKPFIASFRRNLQRTALTQLADMVTPSGGSSPFIFLGLSSSSVPSDAKVITTMHLQTLKDKLATALSKEDLKLDDYSRAHLMDLQKKIEQVLNAELTVNSIN